MPSPRRMHGPSGGGKARRRFSPVSLRARDPNPRAPGGIPTSLTNPTSSVAGPGCTIWKFPAPPAPLHFDGGAIITTARLVPLFWGEFWRTAANPSVADVHQAIEQILLSPYLSEVSQYGFESLTLDPAMIVISPGPPAPTFSGENVKDMVWDLIDADRFPEPDDDGGRIVYMVFAPQGANYDDGNAAGAHNEVTDYDFPFDEDHAWVGWCNHDSIDGITEIFTHELVEILTDPEPYGGWTVDGMPEGENEIVDVCFNETGMVEGYRVSAYYSDRLKACVVPARPHQYGLSVTSKVDKIGRAGAQLVGMTATTRNSICFSGTYEWTVVGQQRRVTLTAATTGYIEPDFEWKVNGVSVFSASALGVPMLPVTTPASTALDPLSMITTLPAQTVTAKVAASGNVLVIESGLGQFSGDFEVACNVTEKRLPNGYHTGRGDIRAVTVTGAVRAMDERFQTDLAKCAHLKSVLARELIEEVVVPRIDLGYPPPVWLERARTEVESASQRQAHQMRELAGFVKGVDADLAASLRHLADGLVAVAAGRAE